MVFRKPAWNEVLAGFKEARSNRDGEIPTFYILSGRLRCTKPSVINSKQEKYAEKEKKAK
jgi:hypothetical protein